MKRWVLALVACGVCVSTLLAQISLDVTLVTLVATVTDSNGRHVPNLVPSDFVVIEDGKEQKISLVEQSDDLPLSIGVLLDTSGSMRTKIQTATISIDRFLRSLDRDDDMFLMTFAAKPKLEQNYTNDRNKISKALRGVKLNNQTALYDAIDQAILKVRDGKHPKKAILLVTDGQDTVSKISLEQAMNDVRQSRVLLYCLGIGSSDVARRGRISGATQRGGFSFGSQDGVDMKVLNGLASASGAKAFLVETNTATPTSIDDVLDEIAAELRSQYTIGYYPNHSPNDGQWHQVVVRTKDSRFVVRSRKEYFGGRSGSSGDRPLNPRTN